MQDWQYGLLAIAIMLATSLLYRMIQASRNAAREQGRILAYRMSSLPEELTVSQEVLDYINSLEAIDLLSLSS